MILAESQEATLDPRTACESVARRTRKAFRAAKDRDDSTGIQTTQDEVDLLIFFRSHLGACIGRSAFRSQIFAGGNTAIVKRLIFSQLRCWRIVKEPGLIFRD